MDRVFRFFYLFLLGAKRFSRRIVSGDPAIPESCLAHKYLDGLRGIEIGASAINPFGLNVKYVGLADEIYEEEQLRVVGKAILPDIVATADDIPLPAESEDFILSSHVVEHCPDLIKTLLEWYRLVRKEGYIFMIVPHPDASPSDRGRPLTTWRHIIEDFRNHANPQTEPECGLFGHCHYHVLSFDSMQEFVRKVFGARLELVDRRRLDDKVGNGFTLVYRKTAALSESFPWDIRVRGDGEPGEPGMALEPETFEKEIA
jgi:SAM-dependent methyltransferase